MLTFENQNIEFKQEYVPDIRKEVMGFANADGGTVYVGIRKDGVVLGVSDHRADVHRTSCALVFALIRVRKHWWDDITQGKQ